MKVISESDQKLTDRTRRWRTLLMLVTACFGLSVAPAYAQVCGDSYLMQGTPTNLTLLNTATNPFTPVPLGGAGLVYNAMGYRTSNNTLYAIQNGTNILLQVNINGTTSSLGAVTGLPDPTSASYIVGEFAPDDRMYVRLSANNNLMYVIDVDAMTATALPLSGPLGVADLAWSNGAFWGVGTSNGMLLSVTTGGTVTTIGPAGTPTSEFGAMLSASNGVFGVNNNGHGAFQFDTTTGQGTLISAAPGSGNNDGARCLTAPLLFNADLAVTKDDGSTTYMPGTNVVYQIAVTNNGPFGVQNALVSDPLPGGISTANWTCVAGAGAVCGTPGGSGALNDAPDLPVGASVTYQVTMAVPITFTGSLTNAVAVSLPAGFTDPNLSNNTAQDVDTSAAQPAVSMVKTGSGPDPLVAGAVVTYSFLVTNSGNLPLTGISVTDRCPD